MSDFIKLLSTNSPAASALCLALLILVLLVIVIVITAFAQGRSITFWPPAIGERPLQQKSARNADATKEGQSDLDTKGPELASPIVDRGTMLKGASGKAYKVTSAFYGGANATLYKAEDQSSNTVIAKLYWRGLAPNSPPWELFQQEQRAAEILSHRNIVRTLDRGLRMGYPFTIIEYLGGGTLRDWLTTHQRLPGRDVLSIASQLADAIDYAHSRGVIHRDIKPGNVLFESDPNGRVALSDFGIAAILGAVQRDITAAEAEFKGSPAYLAPEAVQGDSIGAAADIYGFGVVLFEMIAGVVPFDEYHDPLAIMRAKVTLEAPDIRKVRSDVPDAPAECVAATLARDPAKRPVSARAAITNLYGWLSST